MNSLLAIKYSLFSFVLTIAIAILSVYMNDDNSYIISSLVGILAFIILILSIIGAIKAVKSIRETKKFQVFIAFLLNIFFLTLYSYLIISNS
ncbi:hypothetical protein LPB303_15855 [Polaribacter atrinae]|uniref:Uncharacterized protein n=1 Tax=Polaribacter atrinae TaxID=1333662 RepID=A0A176SYQ9_9FLAO|nr:hypothetical protein [Polaribacter atrinae]OAD40729.1 hypothetical protein LPB303_15855 [Polaribacter atrinae]